MSIEDDRKHLSAEGVSARVPLGVPGYAGAKGAVPEPQGPTTRLYQCPGCWSWGMWPIPVDEHGSLECECGERLTRVDLRDSEARAAAPPDALRKALVTWLFPRGLDHPGAWSLTNEGARAIALAARAAAPPDIDALREALVTALSVVLHEHADPDCTGTPSYDLTQEQATRAVQAALRTPIMSGRLASPDDTRREPSGE